MHIVTWKGTKHHSGKCKVKHTHFPSFLVLQRAKNHLTFITSASQNLSDLQVVISLSCHIHMACHLFNCAHFNREEKWHVEFKHFYIIYHFGNLLSSMSCWCLYFVFTLALLKVAQKCALFGEKNVEGSATNRRRACFYSKSVLF